MDYRPLDPSQLADPYPTFAWLRENDPVHHHPADSDTPAFWALSRFEHVWDAVRRPEDFSSASGVTFFNDEIGKLGLPPTLVMLDPPRQTQLRALIGRGFTPKRVAQLEGSIRAFVRERLTAIGQQAADGESVDFHQDFAATIPTYVLAELFGLPESDREKFGPWVQAITAIQNEGFDVSALDGVAAVGELFGYFSEAISSSRADPGEDLLGALVSAEIDGERLSDWDILGFCFVVVAGGSDTTASLISNGVALLDEAPDQRQLLLDDPTLIPDATLEFLRLESSVQGLARTTTREVSVGGTQIPEGEKVMMLYAAANRDPREFGPTADVLDVRREIPRHLSFSSGPHFCIGSHLARLQARVAFEEVLTAHPHVGVDTAAGLRHRSAFVRGWVSLPATNLGA